MQISKDRQAVVFERSRTCSGLDGRAGMVVVGGVVKAILGILLTRPDSVPYLEAANWVCATGTQPGRSIIPRNDWLCVLVG